MEIIGHKKIKDSLEKEIELGNYSQAYIFSGPKGVGKYSLAKEFACGLVSDKGFSALDPKECHAAGVDMVLVSPLVEEKKGVTKEKEITLEQILDARKELANFPYRGKVKVLIVDESDRMTLKAQNALLKVAEEPNSTSVIILVTSRPNKLLATIQSRCRHITFGLVDQKEIESYFASQKREVASELVTFSMGRPGILKNLLEDKEKIFWFRSSKDKLDKALDGSLNEKMKLAEDLSKNVPEAIQNMEFWSWELHSSCKQKNIFAAEKISEAIDKIKNTNASARLVLENLFINSFSNVI